MSDLVVQEKLSERQQEALRKLTELGAAPRQGPDDPYHSTPQIRALQLVYEGRLGGAGRGQGRKALPRAGELLAERIRKKVDKMENALDRALDSDNDKVALQAVTSAVDIERKEAELSLKEKQFEESLDDLSKEELIDALFSIAGEAQTAAAVEGFIDIPEASVREIIEEAEVIDNEEEGQEETSKPKAARRKAPTAQRHSRAAKANGNNSRSTGTNGQEPDKGTGRKVSNPLTQAARRRASN